MIGVGGECGNRLTIFATGLVACTGSACGDEGGKRNAGGINGKKCGGTGFKTVDGGAGTLMCACCGLSASGALTSVFKGGELGGLTRFNCPGMLDLRGNWWSNCKPSKCIVAWENCRAVFGAFSWVGIPKFIGCDGGVYWGCCCSCMMLFALCASLVTLFLLLVSCGSWTGRLMLASTWPCVLRLECKFGKWDEEERDRIAWLDWAMEPEKCTLGSSATSAMFPAGNELTQSWTSFLLLTELLSVKSLLILPVADPSADAFVINSNSWRAAAATSFRWSSSSCSISNSRNFVGFSISRRCLAMHSFASCCFSIFSL